MIRCIQSFEECEAAEERFKRGELSALGHTLNFGTTRLWNGEPGECVWCGYEFPDPKQALQTIEFK